ncbi:hypothetical protein ACI1US_00927 [Leucobacter sp. BZR 635]
MTGVTRRGFLGFAALLGLAGCTSTSPAELGGEAAGSKPRSVKHVYGTTHIPASVSRVACVGLASHDISLALGVMPIAVQASEALDTKLSPWFHDRMTEVGGRPPEMLARDSWTRVQKSLERLAPDLILAVNGQLSKQHYEELSKIAPVVAHPGAPANTPWREAVAMVATALGAPAAGEKLIATTEGEIADTRGLYADYSELGTLYIGSSGAQGADLEVFGEQTNEVRALREFGLHSAPALAELSIAEQIDPTKRKLVPLDTVRGLTADLVLAAVPDSQRKNELRGGQFSATLGRTNDDTILLRARAEGYAMQESSPLSLSWAAKSVIPDVARVHYASTQQQ